MSHEELLAASVLLREARTELLNLQPGEEQDPNNLRPIHGKITLAANHVAHAMEDARSEAIRRAESTDQERQDRTHGKGPDRL